MSIPLRDLLERHCGGVRGGWENLQVYTILYMSRYYISMSEYLNILLHSKIVAVHQSQSCLHLSALYDIILYAIIAS
jgi:NADH:ubiquinone oxidoreductase subunit F (NADH-binding)